MFPPTVVIRRKTIALSQDISLQMRLLSKIYPLLPWGEDYLYLLKGEQIILGMLLKNFCLDIMRYFPRFYYYLAWQNVMIHEKELQNHFHPCLARCPSLLFVAFLAVIFLYSLCLICTVFGVWVRTVRLRFKATSVSSLFLWPWTNYLLLSRIGLIIRPTEGCHS